MSQTHSIPCVLFVVLAALLSGCATNLEPLTVTQIPGRGAMALDADDVVRVMRQAGFSEREILARGPDVRNAIASSGGAQVASSREVHALLAVSHGRLHVSSRNGMTFVYGADNSSAVGGSAVSPHGGILSSADHTYGSEQPTMR